MDSYLEFINEHYSCGPFTNEATLATSGQRVAYRLRGPGGRYVAKLTDPGRPESIVRTDVGTPACLSARGFPAPRPVPARDGRLYLAYGDRHTYLYEHIEGKHPNPSADFYRRLGELLARLHALPAEDWAPISAYQPEEVLREVREALLTVDSFIGDPGDLTLEAQRAIVPELLEIIDRFPSFAGLPCGIIHTDPYLVNVIETAGGELFLIDWEDGGVSYPLMDIGYVLSYLCTFTIRDQVLWNVPGPKNDLLWRPDWGQVFLEAYEAIRPLTAEERRLLPDAIRLSFLAYIPNGGTSELILDNYRRMKMVLGR